MVLYQVQLTNLLENVHQFSTSVNYNKRWFVAEKCQPGFFFVLERRYEDNSFAIAVAAQQCITSGFSVVARDGFGIRN
jgi:hypothetical protein